MQTKEALLSQACSLGQHRACDRLARIPHRNLALSNLSGREDFPVEIQECSCECHGWSFTLDESKLLVAAASVLGRFPEREFVPGMTLSQAASRLAEIADSGPAKQAADEIERLLSRHGFKRAEIDEAFGIRFFERRDGDLATAVGTRWTHLMDPGGMQLRSEGESIEGLGAWLERMYGKEEDERPEGSGAAGVLHRPGGGRVGRTGGGKDREGGQDPRVRDQGPSREREDADREEPHAEEEGDPECGS